MKSMSHKMMSILFLMLSACPSALLAEETDEYQEGFLTAYLNKAIGKAMAGDEKTDEPLRYGRNITKYVTPPQFGGYVIGKYSYSTKDHADENGFDARLIRIYVSGTLLRDFKYRVQLELKNPSMRDYTLEWVRWKEFQVKIGQFKRCFTYDNPLNPWDVGMGNYSQLSQHMTALISADPSGEPGQNGRDIGLQLQGDLLPVGKDGHRLLRYQAAVYNGNGQNHKDNNKQKDWIGNIQVQPVRGLYLGLFGWTGTYTGANGVSVRRNRWAVGSIMERDDWSFRAEYAHHSGRNVNDFDTQTQTWREGATDRADGWYVLLGVPLTRWLKVYASYDVYREDATFGTMRSIYGICPNFQLHRNLKFQVEYNYINDRTATDHNYHEIWAQTYVRF